MFRRNPKKEVRNRDQKRSQQQTSRFLSLVAAFSSLSSLYCSLEVKLLNRCVWKFVSRVKMRSDVIAVYFGDFMSEKAIFDKCSS